MARGNCKRGGLLKFSEQEILRRNSRDRTDRIDLSFGIERVAKIHSDEGFRAACVYIEFRVAGDDSREIGKVTFYRVGPDARPLPRTKIFYWKLENTDGNR